MTELHDFYDPETKLQAVVAIHSTARGPALGGCRFLPYDSIELAKIDAINLAKAMAFKSAIAQLPLGGGKAVLIAAPQFKDPVIRATALKAFGNFLNSLKGRYITAVDSGTSVADMDHIASQTAFVTSNSKFQYSILDPSVMTARGVFQGILAAVKFKFKKEDLKDIHVVVQGIGHVGAVLVNLLHKAQAKISISDLDLGLLSNIKQKFNNINIINNPEDIYQIKSDIFAPCALGATLNKTNIEQLNTSIVAGAANNQLAEDNIALLLHQKDILYAPDFVINAGGVIHVAGPIMQYTEQQTLNKVDNIYNILLDIFKSSAEQNINPNDVAYKLAYDRLSV